MSTADIRTFSLPDIGEGLTEAFIQRILVKPGDHVEQFAGVIEIETEKSVVELTSPWTGTVLKVLVQDEDWVDVGAPLLEMSVEE